MVPIIPAIIHSVEREREGEKREIDRERERMKRKKEKETERERTKRERTKIMTEKWDMTHIEFYNKKILVTAKFRK